MKKRFILQTGTGDHTMCTADAMASHSGEVQRLIDLECELDAVRQERDSLKVANMRAEVYNSDALERLNTCQAERDSLSRQVKIAVEALEYVAVQRGGRPISVCEKALFEIAKLRGSEGMR